MLIYLFLRETRREGRERKRERKRIPSRLVLSAQSLMQDSILRP